MFLFSKLRNENKKKKAYRHFHSQASKTCHGFYFFNNRVLTSTGAYYHYPVATMSSVFIFGHRKKAPSSFSMNPSPKKPTLANPMYMASLCNIGFPTPQKNCIFPLARQSTRKRYMNSHANY